MNSQFKVKLLQHLSTKKANQGFTLIELLVVVIIIGVLAAIALPNLLGQVGKARESEAKNTIGALNRAQQAYFTEKAVFATSTDLLEVPTGNEKYYTYSIPSAAIQLANGKDNKQNGTKDYLGAVQYDQATRKMNSVVCRGTVKPGFTLTGTEVNNAGSVPDASAALLSCKGANGEEIK